MLQSTIPPELGVFSTTEYAAVAWGIEPACRLVVRFLAGNAGGECVLIQRPYSARFVGVRGDKRADRRAEAVACDVEVEISLRCGGGNGDLEPFVGIFDGMT